MIEGMKIPAGFMIAMGIIIGVVVGALTGNVGLWIVVGIIVGAVAEFRIAKKRSSE